MSIFVPLSVFCLPEQDEWACLLLPDPSPVSCAAPLSHSPVILSILRFWFECFRVSIYYSALDSFTVKSAVCLEFGLHTQFSGVSRGGCFKDLSCLPLLPTRIVVIECEFCM